MVVTIHQECQKRFRQLDYTSFGLYINQFCFFVKGFQKTGDTLICNLLYILQVQLNFGVDIITVLFDECYVVKVYILINVNIKKKFQDNLIRGKLTKRKCVPCTCVSLSREMTKKKGKFSIFLPRKYSFCVHLVVC